MAQACRKRWVVQEDAVDGSLQAEWDCHATTVLIRPTQQEFYVGWVLIYLTWGEENSATIG